MCVESYVAPSALEGVGVFAGEDVPKGTVVWRYLPPLDQAYSAGDIAAMPLLQREFLARYTYWDREIGAFVLCGDHGRFMNHSDDPNVVGYYPGGPDEPGFDIAARDIAAGEEFTCDYGSFDDEAAAKMALEKRYFAKA
ncbi:MAG TPA: SET domain-containing protein [Paracoccaceae bacterium]|nr:SET domain-containing protein [Paracoccaceae bacterium]